MRNNKKHIGAILLGLLLVCTFAKQFVVDSYMVITASMSPTIKAGQKIIVNKMLFGTRLSINHNLKEKRGIKRLPGIRAIAPNDIICFNSPKGVWGQIQYNDDVVYCKRVLGTPGDRIGAVDGHYWNDKFLKPIGVVEEQERLRWMFDGAFIWNNSFDVLPESGLGWNIKNWGPLTVPAQGMTISLDETNRELYRHVIEYETGGEMDGLLNTYTFRCNYFFVVGDNVMNSNDSRYWGFIPEDFIIGIVCGKKVRNNPNQTYIDYDMKSRYRTYTLIMCIIIAAIIISCYGKSEAITVRRDTVNVGRANVGDSICATFKFRNNTYATQTVTFLPECDCTTVSAESMELGPHKRGSIEVKVAVESPGEFTKYVYVQAAGGDVFFSIAIKGRGK